MYKILIYILLLNCVFSQNISGTIQNESGKKLEGVNIFIPVLNRGTYSDTNGMFNIRKLPSTSLAVHFTMIGYESQILIFKINSEPITITMLKSVIEMEPIVVSGGSDPSGGFCNRTSLNLGNSTLACAEEKPETHCTSCRPRWKSQPGKPEIHHQA